MNRFRKIAGLTLLSLGILSGTGCTTLSVNDDPGVHTSNDPLEGLNRSIYSFNQTADKLILRPAAKAYNASLPKPAKTGVKNFFSNLREPLNILNSLLQGKGEKAMGATYRFAVNSTVGLFGLIDVANYQGVKPSREDFGQTLAAWSIGPGPYLMLPLLGPSNLRDGIARLIDSALYYPINEISNSSKTRTGLTILDVVSLRTSLLGTDKILESQIDEYAFLKHTFEQNRILSLYDGKPPPSNTEDFNDF